MPTSGASAANRESTDAYKLILGTDAGVTNSDTTRGIIGSMFFAGYTPFTGMLQANVYERDILPSWAKMPQAWIFAAAESGYSEEVGGNPAKVTTLKVTSTFRVQAQSNTLSHFDLEFYRQAYADMVINATRPTHDINNFRCASSSTFSVYKVLPFWEMNQAVLENTDNGECYTGNVVHKVMVKRG